MKALSVRPPWSWAIAHGGKRVENRTRPVSFRGEFAVHASLRWDPAGVEFPPLAAAWKAMRDNPPAGWDAVGPMVPGHPLLPSGAVVAVATLSGVCSASAGLHDWATLECGCGGWAAPGLHHLLIADVRPLRKPILVKGALGLWNLPDDVHAQVVRGLPAGGAR